MSSANSNIEIADRLDALAEEIQGLSEILSIMREGADLQGTSSAYLLMLGKVTERYSRELREISSLVKPKKE